MSTIYCDTDEDFFDAIAALVMRGLTFKADFTRRTIDLTGGF